MNGPWCCRLCGRWCKVGSSRSHHSPWSASCSSQHTLAHSRRCIDVPSIISNFVHYKLFCLSFNRSQYIYEESRVSPLIGGGEICSIWYRNWFTIILYVSKVYKVKISHGTVKNDHFYISKRYSKKIQQSWNQQAFIYSVIV